VFSLKSKVAKRDKYLALHVNEAHNRFRNGKKHSLGITPISFDLQSKPGVTTKLKWASSSKYANYRNGEPGAAVTLEALDSLQKHTLCLHRRVLF
jgi:hypothetical protein